MTTKTHTPKVSKTKPKAIIPKIEVIEAYYGRDGFNFLNVTDFINEKINSGKLNFIVSNSLFNCEAVNDDPAYGYCKVLAVKLLRDGKLTFAVAFEGNEIIF